MLFFHPAIFTQQASYVKMFRELSLQCSNGKTISDNEFASEACEAKQSHHFYSKAASSG
jgi:hypothetical protein